MARGQRVTAGLGLVLGIGAWLATATNTARAEPIDGRFRIWTEIVPVVAFSGKFTATGADAAGDRREIEIDETYLGLVPTQLGVGVGYALGDEFTLGLQCSFVVTSDLEDEGGAEHDVSAFTFKLLPYFAYVHAWPCACSGAPRPGRPAASG